MKKDIKHNCAVLLFSNSWGEIDTILPFIKKFKKKKKIKIISIFTNQSNYENKKRFKDLMYILGKISHEIYTPKNTLHFNLVANLFYLFRFDLLNFFKTILSLISFRQTDEIEENLYINRITKDYSVKYIFSGQASPVKKKWLKLNPKKLIFYPQAITIRGFKFRFNRDFNYKKYDIERKKSTQFIKFIQIKVFF